MKAAVVEVVDYERWIRGLRDDREWIVQVKQAELSKSLHEIMADVYGFILPLRYDFSIALIDGITCDIFDLCDKLRGTISRILPLKVKIGVGYGMTLKEAQLRATNMLISNEDDFIDDFYKPSEKIVAAHIDVNSFMRETANGVYNTYQMMMRLYSSIMDFADRIGGLAYYLGGDNIILFSSVRELHLLDKLSNDGVKVGVGVAENPRKALSLAAKALEEIRLSNYNYKVKIVGGSER